MPRKTDSNNPADWLFLCHQDLEALEEMARKEIGYHLCRGKLAEVVEKLMKAELIREGWRLEKTHDIRKLFGELDSRNSNLCDGLRALVVGYAEDYFADRYLGFDLDDADWDSFKSDLTSVVAVF